MTLVLLALAWLGAIAVAALWAAPWWMGGAWLLAASPGLLAFAGRKAAAVALVCALFAFGAGYRYDGWAARTPPPVAAAVGSEVTVEGTIASEPDPGLTTVSYEVEVDRSKRGGGDYAPSGGKILVTVGQYAHYRHGAPVRVTGRLRNAPVYPDFDYRAYLARQGIVGTMSRARIEVRGSSPGWDYRATAGEVRRALDRGLARSLPEPEASLAAGIGLGRDGNVPRELYDDYRDAGLAHLVAVSGTNVAIVTGLVFALLVPVAGRRWAMIPAGAVILAYAAVAGAEPAVVRAAIMAAVFLGGAALGRQQSGLAALGGAAIAMTALQPGLVHDAGFQLSLAATAGLIVFAPWVHHALRRGTARLHLEALLPDALLQVSAFSLAATVATTPLVWVNFGRVSLAGPVANLVAEPLFALTFVLSLATALAAVVWEPAGWTLGLAAFYPLHLLNWLAGAVAAVPFAAVNVPGAGAKGAFAAYLALAIAGWPCYRFLAPAARPRPTPRTRARLVVMAAALGGLGAAVAVLGLRQAGGPGRLEVAFLDVGQGDAILVTTPRGHRYLIDGGPSGIGLARELGAVLPHWERDLEGVILTHPQEDHLGGLGEALARYDVAQVFDNGATATTPAFAAYAQEAGQRRTLRLGDRLEDDGVVFEVLWPPPGSLPREVNETSIVLRVTYGATSLLLPGDIEAATQRRIMATNALQTDVLKVPHHGSKTSAREFFAETAPALAVISVGEGNRFGHPAPATLAALGDAATFRTDEHGRITVTSDGRAWSYRTER